MNGSHRQDSSSCRFEKPSQSLYRLDWTGPLQREFFNRVSKAPPGAQHENCASQCELHAYEAPRRDQECADQGQHVASLSEPVMVFVDEYRVRPFGRPCRDPDSIIGSTQGLIRKCIGIRYEYDSAGAHILC